MAPEKTQDNKQEGPLQDNNQDQQQERPGLLLKTIEATERGLQLHSLDDYWRFAQYVMRSGLSLKGDCPESLVIKVQFGAELGLPPMQAIQSIAVINGRPSVWGDAVPGLCMASGVFDHAAFREWMDGDGDARVAHCQVRRLGGAVVLRSFSWTDAKLAGLTEKSGPWKQHANRMLQMRARGFAMRDAFPDVLRGCAVSWGGELEDEAPDLTAAVRATDEPPRTLKAVTEKLKSPEAMADRLSDENLKAAAARTKAALKASKEAKEKAEAGVIPAAMVSPGGERLF